MALLFGQHATSYGQFSFELGASIIGSNNRQMYFANVRELTSNGAPNGVYDTAYYSCEYAAGGFGVLTYPKFGVATFKDFNISVGTPINLAYSANSQTGTSSWLIDLNIAVDINGGTYNKKSKKDALFGYYGGIGFGVTNAGDDGIGYDLVMDQGVTASTPNLQYINTDKEGFESYMNAKSTGLLLQAGIGDFRFLDRFAFLNNAGLRLARRIGGKSKPSYTMFSLLIHF